jgi:hypothetical protein
MSNDTNPARIDWKSTAEMHMDEAESLRNQLSDHIKREVMLRDALETCKVGDFSTGHVIYPSFDEQLVNNALAATDDLDGLILCKKKPTAWCQDVTYEMAPKFAFSWVQTQLHDFPLYRAWEPK